ncbi:hypothetical protein HLRTI_003242 [Halorhabdus tiamatea SARL4B]|uniref:Uncharacterized protein n=1 Tax=Halorhabdus tiamatea SARL4B TaxID=1033806 RepID=U2F894_9EURY|nr:hypothetical protein [Halorhabdus tiamatea]ERJ04774.1 hypothetical protein HLRTI_003242 [Halorhabdus tiamatea SARL4B]
MDYRVSNGVVIGLSVAIIGWTLLWLQQPIFGIAVVSGLTTSYTTWRHEKPGEAGLLIALWNLIAVAAWTANLLFIAGSVVIAGIVYFAWTVRK